MQRFFGGIHAAFIREWNRIFRSATYTSILFILPIVSFIFFALFFRQGIADNLPIAVVDNDHTDLSRTLVKMVDETPAALVRFEVQEVGEGMQLIREGKAYAVLFIPSGFEKDIMGNSQSHVEFYNSGTNISTNSLLAKDVQTAVTTFSVGIQLQILQKKGLSASQAMVQAQPIRFTKHVLFNPYTNYGYYVAPCFMAMMLMIFTIMASIYAVGTELKFGTAKEWIDESNGSLAAAIIGKLSPVGMTMILVAVAMFVVIFNIMGAPLNGSPWLLGAATVVFIICYQCIGVAILALTANMRLALSLGGGYSVLAFTFSGLTFPTMAMATVLQWFSYFFPFTFYMRIFVDQAMRGTPVGISLPNIAYMILFWALPVIMARHLRKICTDKKYWGRL